MRSRYRSASGVTNRALDCVLYCRSTSEAVTQLFAGFAMLRRQGLARVTVKRTAAGVPNLHYLFAEIGGSTRIAFDLVDAVELNEKALRWCDVYVKRSYETAYLADRASAKPVIPFGLNYSTSAKGDWTGRRIAYTLRSRRDMGLRRVAIQSIRASGPLSFVTREKFGRALVDHYECLPTPRRAPKAFCFTRVWDPAEVAGRPEQADHWREISELRAGSVRALRRELGPRFLGGLADSPYARRVFPDLVPRPSPVRSRRDYLRVMKEHDVGVVFAGLWRSNGFRLGEFAAASRAMVSEPVAHAVPGDFRAGVNYLEFESVDQCVSATVSLLEDDARREQMMRANCAYYHAYVRPDMIVWNCLKRALELA